MSIHTYSKSNDGILQNLKELDYLLLSEKLPAAFSAVTPSSEGSDQM